MKQVDVVALSGDSLYLNFAASGTTCRASFLNVTGGMSFRIDGNALLATPQDDQETTIAIEAFSDEAKARAALDDVHRAVRGHMRETRAMSIGRGMAKYLALPLGVLFLVAGAIGTVAGRAAGGPPGASVPQSSTPSNTAALASLPAPMEPHAAPDAERLRVSPEQVAQALKQGAASGRYAVRLGDAIKGDPVYVFEDPQCPHCREFSPELLKISKARPVFVFPVSAIGGESSVRMNALTLCTPAEKRGTTWAMALTGALSDRGPTQREPTTECSQAVQANDLIYETIGIKGTPTIFNAKGQKMPYSVEQTADAIGKWLTGES